jgi:hypothetical protein
MAAFKRRESTLYKGKPALSFRAHQSARREYFHMVGSEGCVMLKHSSMLLAHMLSQVSICTILRRVSSESALNRGMYW